MRRDPVERYDVKDQYPEVIRLLQSIAEEARFDLGDDLTGQKGLNRRDVGYIK